MIYELPLIIIKRPIGIYENKIQIKYVMMTSFNYELRINLIRWSSIFIFLFSANDGE